MVSLTYVRQGVRKKMIAIAKLELIAHRGRVTRVRDENTIKAFKKSVQDGATWIECDIRYNQPTQTNYIFHDSTLKRLLGMPDDFDTYSNLFYLI